MINNLTIREGYHSGISILRIMATISVIWLHVCSTLAENPDIFQMTDLQFKFFNAGYQMMYWTVPVFFMITGALLLNPSKSITAIDCVWKYGKRIVLALLIFGIPFAVLKLAMESGVSITLIPLSVKAVFENQGLAHLWYLYTLVGIYLILPILRWFVVKANDSETELVIVALMILDFIIPLINKVCGLSIAFDVPLKYPVLYILLGWYFGKLDVQKYKKASLFVTIAIIALIWTLNYTVDNAVDWTSYNGPLILALAVSIFAIFKSVTVEGIEWLWKVDRLCFAVYLIHPLFIQFTYRFLKITPVELTGLYPIAAVAFFLVVVIMAFIGGWILNMIKPLRKYVL